MIGKLAQEIFDKIFVTKSVQFVFHLALPCHVAFDIGVWVDFNVSVTFPAVPFGVPQTGV